MRRLTEEDVETGIKKLERMLFDQFYEVSITQGSGAVPKSMSLLHSVHKKKSSVATQKINSGRDICLFAKGIYELLKSNEKDQPIIVALKYLAFGIKNKLMQGQQQLPNHFQSAYESVLRTKPELVAFDYNRLFKMHESELSQIAEKMAKSSLSLESGNNIFISRLRKMTELANQRGMGDIFRYKDEVYSTLYFHNQIFKKTLKQLLRFWKIELPSYH